MKKLHTSLGPNPRLARMFLMEKGLVEGTDFERVHYDIIRWCNARSGNSHWAWGVGLVARAEACLSTGCPFWYSMELQQPWRPRNEQS